MFLSRRFWGRDKLYMVCRTIDYDWTRSVQKQGNVKRPFAVNFQERVDLFQYELLGNVKRHMPDENESNFLALLLSVYPVPFCQN